MYHKNMTMCYLYLQCKLVITGAFKENRTAGIKKY